MKRLLPYLLLLSSTLLAAPTYAACWTAVPQTSAIVFTVSQAGAPMQGTFHDYDALVCMGNDAGDDHIRVSVRTASVDTQLPELDEALRGTDFFDVSRWPQAVFESESVKPLGQGRYQVIGKLTLRDVTRELSVPFSLTPASNGGAKLEGRLIIQRLDYNIGLGQWADTRWVGNPVDLSFLVVLKPVTGK